MNKYSPIESPQMTASFADLIDRFDRRRRLAVLSGALDVNTNTISQMRSRGRIPSEHWAAFQCAAKGEAIVVTDGELARAEKLYQAAKKEPELDFGAGHDAG